MGLFSFSGPSQKGELSIQLYSHICSLSFLEIERSQQKDLRNNERDLDRQLRNLTLQEQKLVQHLL